MNAMCGDAVHTHDYTYQCVCVILHISVITQEGVSALAMAAELDKIETVVELVKAGANVDMRSKVRSYVNTFVVHTLL